MTRDEERTERISEFFDQVALRNRAPEGPPATGRCLSCDEPVAPPRRWCDADCRDDWEREHSRA